MAGPRQAGPRQAGQRRATRREWLQRLGWMAALWAGGVSTLAAVAYVIRVLMHALGMR